MKPAFVFIKTEHGSWRNDEPAGPVRDALDDFKNTVLSTCGTPSYFETLDQLKFEALASIQKWTDKGRPGAHKTFLSRAEFFAPFELPTTTPRLFDFAQTLQGRKRERETLTSFLSNPNQLVLIIAGRGGIGKTKVLHHWTADLGGLHVVFLHPGSTWHAESDKEIPLGDVVVVADDAHRASHIPELLSLVRTMAQKPGRKVKLVLSARPSGLAALRSTLSRFLEPGQVSELRLEKLNLEEVRALASQLLGTEYANLRDWLVAASADTPLVTVIGARLITGGKLSSTAISNETEFQRAVFDRFIEEYTTALPQDGFPWEKLIYLLAAVGPAQIQSDDFRNASEAFLGIPRHEIAQAIDRLEKNGLLISMDNRRRIAPDTLADFLLEGGCVNSHGETRNVSAGAAPITIARRSRLCIDTGWPFGWVCL